MRRFVTCAVLLCPSLCLAQQRLEITPTLSFRYGGAITLEERAFYHDDFSADISTSETFGLRLAIPVSQRVAIELLGSQQRSEIEDEYGFFGEQPGGFFEPGQSDMADFEVSYYHVGVVWDLGTATTRGFLVVSAGVAQISTNLPLPSDDPISASVGGGVQIDLTQHFGLLFEARFYWSDTDDQITATQQFSHRDCTDPCTYTYRYESNMTQGEISFGLVFRP